MVYLFQKNMVYLGYLNTMVKQSIPWCFETCKKVNHGMPYITIHNDKAWHTMAYHGISWYIVVYFHKGLSSSTYLCVSNVANWFVSKLANC